MEWMVRKIQDFDPAESRRCLALLPPGRQTKARPQSLLGEWMVRTALAAQFGLFLWARPMVETTWAQAFEQLMADQKKVQEEAEVPKRKLSDFL